MKQIAMHYEMDFSLTSCYSKHGNPKSGYPPMIMVESPTLVWGKISEMVDEYVKTNGFDFDKVRDYLYSLIPNEFECTVYNNRKTIVGYMQAGGVSWMVAAVVRGCLKDVIEKYPALRNEYLFKEVKIFRKGEDIDEGSFYLLITPNIPRKELIFPKCVFRKPDYEPSNDEMVVFKDYDEYFKHLLGYHPVMITLPAKYKDLKLISIGGFGLFVSYQIAHEIRKANWIDGYEFGTLLLFDE